MLVHSPLLLLSLALFGCFTALKRYEIVFVGDTSGSMNGKKIQDAKEAQFRFLDSISSVEAKVGLVTFGGRVRLLQRPSNNIEKVRKAVEQMKADGRTPLYKALKVGYRQVTDNEGVGNLVAKLAKIIRGKKKSEKTSQKKDLNSEKIIILTSDGRATGGHSNAEIKRLGERIKTEGIDIVTVAIGKEADTSLLSALASKREYFYKASSSGELPEIFEDIQAKLVAL